MLYGAFKRTRVMHLAGYPNYTLSLSHHVYHLRKAELGCSSSHDDFKLSHELSYRADNQVFVTLRILTFIKYSRQMFNNLKEG